MRGCNQPADWSLLHRVLVFMCVCTTICFLAYCLEVCCEQPSILLLQCGAQAGLGKV